MRDGQFTLGKYRILEELGRGGMGVVYLAEDSNLKRKVALKTLRPTLGNTRKHIEGFQREGQAVASLNHPNIVHINALEFIDGQLVIEMPYFARGSVRDLLQDAIPPRDVARILRDVLMALECCHEAGIIHRDVKPNNLLIDDGGRVLLGDFGVAALLDAEWEATMTGESTSMCFAGTPLYMSPGAWDGTSPTPHQDLYALGIIAREALTGEPPFTAHSAMALMRQIMEVPLPPIRDVLPELSPEFGDLIDALTRRSEAGDAISASTALHRLRDAPEFESPDSDLAITVDIPRSALRRQRAHRARSVAVPPWIGRYSVHILIAVTAGFAGFLAHRSIAPGPEPIPSPSAGAQETGRPLRQVDVSADTVPTAEALLSSWQVLDPERRRVILATSTARPETPFPVLLQVNAAEGTATLAAWEGNSIWGFDLRRNSGDRYALSGTWAQYATDDGEAFRWASLGGSARWDGDRGGPRWLEIQGVSQTDVARWSETWILDGSPTTGMTDTAFLHDFEAAPATLAIIYNELPSRVQAEPWDFRPMLPSLHRGRLSVSAIPSGTRPDVDGQLIDHTWLTVPAAAVYPGSPTRGGAQLRAAYTAEALYLAVSLPAPVENSWEVELVFTERFAVPLATTARLHGFWSAEHRRLDRFTGDSSTPERPGWELQSTQGADGFSAEIRIPFAQPVTGEVSAMPTPRLNLAIYNRSAPDSRSAVAQWGWPDVAAFAHGLELHFVPSGEGGPPP